MTDPLLTGLWDAQPPARSTVTAFGVSGLANTLRVQAAIARSVAPRAVSFDTLLGDA